MAQAIAADLLMAPEARQGRLMVRAPEVPAGLEQVVERAVLQVVLQAAIREALVVQAEPVVQVLAGRVAGQVVQVLAGQVVQAGRAGQVVQVVGRAAVLAAELVALEPVAPATTEQWEQVVQQAVLPGVFLEALACQTP